MNQLLRDLWQEEKIDISRNFRDSWEEDFFRSQLRFLPEPEPGTGLFWETGDYWVQIRSPKSLVHPFSETLWIDERGIRYQVIPRSLLRLRRKGALRRLFSAK